MKTKFILAATLVLVTILQATAQQKDILKYYDEYWSPVPKDSAKFYAVFTPTNKGYNCTSWYLQSKKLRGISFQSDTTFETPKGLVRTYYEAGQLEDSSYYDPQSGTLLSMFHYYPGGKLWANYLYNTKNKTGDTKGYDEAGKEIKNFIYAREAEFKTGRAAWLQYLSSHLKRNTPVKNGAPKGEYNIVIRFSVAPDGAITDVEAETDLGYGMEDEGIRVIRNSPKWLPAVLLNNPLKAYRRQPLTFVVVEK